MDDERHYQEVADELREGRVKEALWTKATAQSMGDEHKTKALYIRMRVDQLMREEARSQSPDTEDETGETSATLSRAAQLVQWVVAAILIVVILGVVKKLLWPKLQTYL